MKNNMTVDKMVKNELLLETIALIKKTQVKDVLDLIMLLQDEDLDFSIEKDNKNPLIAYIEVKDQCLPYGGFIVCKDENDTLEIDYMLYADNYYGVESGKVIL